jgi:hypothetical protein
MTDHADNLEREETISDLDLPYGEAELVKGGRKGIVTNNNDPDVLGAVRARGAGVIQNLSVKYT